nr:uncharacterized protein LOC118030846 isoform X1 [Populus alba]
MGISITVCSFCCSVLWHGLWNRFFGFVGTMEDIFNVFKEGLGLCLRRRGVCGRRGMLGFSMTLFISLALTVVSPADIQPDYKLKAGNIVCSLGRGEDGQLGHGYGCLPDRYQVAGDSPWHWLLMENFMAWDGISLDRSEMVIQPTIENCVGAQLRRVLARTSCDFCIAPSPSQLLVGRNSHRVLHHRIIRVPKICTHK